MDHGQFLSKFIEHVAQLSDRSKFLRICDNLYLHLMTVRIKTLYTKLQKL